MSKPATKIPLAVWLTDPVVSCWTLDARQLRRLKAELPRARIVACRSAQIIVGPIGIAIADALMGEISPAMANAVASSNAYRVLIPMNLCSTYVAGVDKKSSAILDDAMAHIRSLLEGMENKP